MDEKQNLITIARMGAFYNFCKYNTRLTAHIYYKNIIVNGSENIPKDKPVLLLPNHPNSFLDAVIVGASIHRPTYFLARGDAFNSKIANPILRSLNMLPVFRLSEGKENLTRNTETFDACQDILEKGQIVLLFPEGVSENNWALRPLKKGPPRIARKAWMSNTLATDMVVVPVGLTYEHYKAGGKTILVQIGKPLLKTDFDYTSNEAAFVKQFNDRISSELSQLAYYNPEMKNGDEAHMEYRGKLQKYAQTEKQVTQILDKLKQSEKGLQVSNARFAEWSILFFPLYRLSTWLSPKIVKQGIFYDSICFGLFLFLWPIYLVVLGLLLNLIF